MSDFDKLVGVLSNLYTAVFEQTPPSFNQPLIDVIATDESEMLSGADGSGAASQQPYLPMRGHGQLTITGAIGGSNAPASAARMEEATTNRVPDPRGTDYTQVTSYATGATGSNATGQLGPYGITTAIKVTLGGAYAGDVNIARYDTMNGSLALNAPYALRCSFKGEGSAIGKTASVGLRVLSPSGNHDLTFGTVVLTGAYQEATVLDVLDVADATSVSLRVRIAGGANGDVFYFTATGCEERAYLTTHCDGSLGSGYAWVSTPNASRSTRAISVVSYGSGVIDKTQSSLVFRFHTLFDSVLNGNNNRFLFSVSYSGNYYVQVYWEGSSKTWVISQYDGVTVRYAAVADTFAVGAVRTIAARYSAGECAISLNGAAFVNTPSGTLAITPPALLATCYIGSRGGADSAANVEMYWAVAFTGYINSSLANSLYLLGDTDPQLTDLPATWKPSLLCYFANKSFDTLATYAFGKGYWKLADAAGTTAPVETLENGILNGVATGVTFGGVGLIPSETDTSASFNGTTDKITVADIGRIQNLFDGGATIIALINPTNAGGGSNGSIVDKAQWRWSVKNLSGGKLDMQFDLNYATTNGQWATSTLPITTAVANLVGVSYNASTPTIPATFFNGARFIDAPSVIAAPSGARTTDVGSAMVIGNNAGQTRGFAGSAEKLLIVPFIVTLRQWREFWEAFQYQGKVHIEDLTDRAGECLVNASGT